MTVLQSVGLHHTPGTVEGGEVLQPISLHHTPGTVEGGE